jgi:hypothetical protein
VTGVQTCALPISSPYEFNKLMGWEVLNQIIAWLVTLLLVEETFPPRCASECI